MCWAITDTTKWKSSRPLVERDSIDEGMIVHNLRARFLDDKIYTYVGSILVAINPFKRLPLYTLDVLNEYVKSVSGLS